MTFKEPEDEEFDRIEREQNQRQTFKINWGQLAVKTQFQTIDANPKPILTITAQGDVLWRDRMIESDDDFRAAMLDLKKHFDGMNRPRAVNIQRLNRQQVLDIWNTIYPEGSIIDSDNFIYEFADAIQTYLGIGEKHGT